MKKRYKLLFSVPLTESLTGLDCKVLAADITNILVEQLFSKLLFKIFLDRSTSKYLFTQIPDFWR